jgi:hypothetical protein
MSDTGKARAEKAYPRCNCGEINCDRHAPPPQRAGYERGWNERGEVTEAMVEVGIIALLDALRYSQKAGLGAAVSAALKAALESEGEQG